MGLFSFLDSKSSSSSSTSSQDESFVAGNNSTNAVVNLDGSNNSVTTTDFGAVSGGLKLALAGVEGANQLASQAQTQTSDLMSGIFKQNAAQAANLTQAVVDLKTSDVRTLVIAGIAVVGLVAVQLFKRKAA